MKRLSTTSLAVVVSTFLFVLISTLLFLTTARADSWSWTSGEPTVVRNDEASRNMEWDNICAAKYQGGSKHSRKIEGQYNQYPEYFTDCLLAEGNNFQLFTRGNSLSVSFAGESHAHAIRGVECVSHACIYMPSRDYLITTINARGIGGTPIIVYKNFIRNLQKQRILYPNLQSEVAFNASPDPDLVLSARFDSGSYTATTVWMQRSVNDRWLVFEIVGVGIFRMDMDTYQTIKVADFRTNYWSLGPNIDFDITGDGQHIAIFGFNSLNAIYEITPGCGAVIPDSPTYMQLISPEGGTNCPYLSLPEMFSKPNGVLHMPNFGAAHQPRFSDDGGEISFYTLPYQGSSDPPRHITLRASGYTGPKPLDYLALGDSYSSGEGDIDPYGTNYYRRHTDNEEDKSKGVPKEKCHISTRSYPYLLATRMGLSISGPKQWDTVTCSGATTHDINSSNTAIYKGQGDRLKDFGYGALQSQALNEFIPGRQEQIEFVRKYKPKVITLSIGGNDVDFANKLTLCASKIDTCDYVNIDRAKLGSQIRSQFHILKSLYEDLYKASEKRARIYVVSYPNFINDKDDTVCGANMMFLNRDEREMISSSISFLNSVIRQASLAAGVEFIDIEHSLDGHRLCDNGEDYENAAIWRIGTLGFSDYGSFHPNSKGQQAIGNTIWSSLVESGSCITNLSNCSNDFDISVDPSATEDTIDIPAYFQNIEWRNSFYKNLTSFDQIINGTVDISVGSYTFASGTIATITGHSNPVNLGEYITASDGSLHATLRLPLSMDIGFHRIIVSGTSYTGVPVEYEQIIYIGGGEEDNAAAEDEHLAHMLSESRPGEPDARFKSPIPALYFRNSDLINHGSPRKAGDTTIKSDFSLHLLIGIITVAAYITLSVMKKLVNKRS